MDDPARLAAPDRAADLFRFGVFELDLRRGELRRSGQPVRLGPQPLRLLELLACHAGQLVVRDQIREALWPGSVVDFEQRLKSCVNQVRHALGDDSEAPRYLETVPRRGYRWVAPVERVCGYPGPGRGSSLVLPFPSDRTLPGAPRTPPGHRRWRVIAWLATGTAVAALAALGLVLWLRPRPADPVHWQRLTFHRGFVSQARFGLGGEIVFAGAWEGRPRGIFAVQPPAPEPRRLAGMADERLVGISTNGEVGLMERGPTGWTLLRVSEATGARRAVLDGVVRADWTPDGRGFAVARRAGRHLQMELPTGHVVGYMDLVQQMRVSPDGERVAVHEARYPNDDAGHVVVLDRAGRRTQITGELASLSGLAWSPDGQEVWFTGTHAGNDLELRAANMSGRVRSLLTAGSRLTLHDVDHRGRVLLDRSLSRVGVLYGRTDRDVPERELAWLDASMGVALTRDGSRLLLVEGGNAAGPEYSIYLRETGGAAPVRIGSGRPTDLSPDARWVAAIPVANPDRIDLLPTGPGDARVLRHDGWRYEWASFLPDGRELLFVARGPEADAPWRGYRQSLAGGAPRALGEFRLNGNAISPDGRHVAAWAREAAGILLQPLAGGAPRVIPGTQQDAPLWWASDSRQLYVRRRGALPARVERLDVWSGRRTTWRELHPPDPVGVVSVAEIVGTPDGRAYAYTYHRRLSELFLIEGLR